MVRYGVIGLGSWARKVHIPNINLLPRAKITALCSRSKANLEIARRMVRGAPLLFQDYRDLLQCAVVDAVLVCAPNDLHAQMAVEAMQADKHVLCEKPLGLSLQECDRVIDVWQRSARLLQVGFELRFSPMFLWARKLIADGSIGEAAMVWCHLFRRPLTMREWRQEKKRFGGVFLDLACHYLDIFEFLLDAAPVRVACTGGRKCTPIEPDNCWVWIDYDDGTRGCFGLCLFSPFGNETIVGVLATKGKIEMDLRRVRMRLYGVETHVVNERLFASPGGIIHGFTGSYEEHASFVDSVLSARTSSPTVQAARRSVSISLAIEESLRKGSPVCLHSTPFRSS